MYSDFQSCLSAAVDAAICAEIPDESFSETVHAQACLLARINPDDLLWHYTD